MRFALETRTGPGPPSEFADTLRVVIEDLGGQVAPEDERPDMVLSAGGDGTMLGAVRKALAWDVPVLGFNLGTIGFLAQAEPEDAVKVMKTVMSGEYRTEDRMTLAATLGETTLTGINDVVVEKVDTTRLVHIDVTVDGESFITYRADGLIVATPTGSTAYSFSAGGPLIDPTMEALVITPVASHSLFNRAMVLPATSVIGLKVSRDREARGNVDKTPLGVIGEGGHVEVRRGERPARFVAFGTRRFPSVVRQKFKLT